MNVNAGNLKKGEFIKYQGEIYQIQKTEFYSPGKGSALMRTRIKNVATGKQVDPTFKSMETVEVVEVESIQMQFLYKDAEYLYFMDQQSYNQFQIALDVVGETADFLKEGETCYVYVHNEQPLNIRPPASVRLKVIETEDAVKGDTVSGAKKPAVLETGVTIQVPLFVKQGETIVVNPETGEYVERAS
jgi:elongation factor P